MIGTFSAAANFLTNINLINKPCVILLGGIAFILSIVAFGVCLYSLPARKGYMRVGESWGTFSKLAYDKLCEKKQSAYRDTISSLIDEFDSAALHNLNTNNQRAKLLRITSWVLIFSFCLGLLTTISAGIEYVSQKNNMEESMTTNSTNQDDGSSNVSQDQGDSSSKPDAQVPQGPISGKPLKIITHGDNTPKNTIVITEDIEKRSK